MKREAANTGFVSRALRAEIRKTRRRFLWVLPLGVVLLEFLILATNEYAYRPEVAADGYFYLIWGIPIYNTIFLPLALAVMASRICDAENRGNTWKLLCTMQEKKQLFDVKLLFGGLYALFLTALEALLIPALGQVIPIPQAFPVRHYLIFLGVLFVVSWALFLMQQVLSLLIESQLIPLFIGLLGSFVGVFSAFFPMDQVTGFLPWGYYIVGMTFSSWYDEENRISHFYEVPFRWPWFLAFLIVFLILYFAGKRLFLKKEV